MAEVVPDTLGETVCSLCYNFSHNPSTISEPDARVSHHRYIGSHAAINITIPHNALSHKSLSTPPAAALTCHLLFSLCAPRPNNSEVRPLQP